MCGSHADSVYTHIFYPPYQDWTIAHGHLMTNHNHSFFHTSSKREEPKHKLKAGSLLYTEHNQ